MRIHQLFLNRNGWLVAAPYRTAGEKIPEKGLDRSAIIGDYDIILHRLDIDYEHYGVNRPEHIRLNEDGSITGDHGGNWETTKDTPYLTLRLESADDKESDTYEGVLLRMKVDDTDVETTVFTALGEKNQLAVWGYRNAE